jgi:hypothetical protein
MSAPGDDYLSTVGISDKNQFTDMTLFTKGLVHFRMCPTGTEDASYFVTNCTWKPSSPDITMYHGPDREAPIVAVGHLTRCSTNTMGVGDFSKADADQAMTWETLQRTNKWSYRKYHFSCNFGGEKERRGNFEWTRVKRCPYILQLVELSNPDVVLGTFLPGPGFKVKNRGRILVKKGYGEEWERMAMLTALALLELMRRRVSWKSYD